MRYSGSAPGSFMVRLASLVTAVAAASTCKTSRSPRPLRDDPEVTVGSRPMSAATAVHEAPASSTASSSMPSAARAEPEGLDEFFDARIRNARAGRAELVRIPIWHCGPTCSCPPPCLSAPGKESSHWLDFDASSANGIHSAWHNSEIPEWEARMVTGFFTGQAVERDGDGCSVPTKKCRQGAPSHSVWEFRALTSVAAPNVGGPSWQWEDLPLSAWPRVLRPDRGFLAWPPPLDTGRPWLVLVASFPLGEPESVAAAERFSSELRAQGWSDAEVIDSRSARALDCCYLVVTVGRWPTRDAAEAVRQRVLRGHDATVRRAL
jgi:hypothetical protein